MRRNTQRRKSQIGRQRLGLLIGHARGLDVVPTPVWSAATQRRGVSRGKGSLQQMQEILEDGSVRAGRIRVQDEDGVIRVGGVEASLGGEGDGGCHGRFCRIVSEHTSNSDRNIPNGNEPSVLKTLPSMTALPL